MFEFFNTLLSIFGCTDGTDSLKSLLFRKIITCFTLLLSFNLSLCCRYTDTFIDSLGIPKHTEILLPEMLPSKHRVFYSAPKVQGAQYFFGHQGWGIEHVFHEDVITKINLRYVEPKLTTIHIDTCMRYIIDLQRTTDVHEYHGQQIADRLSGLTSGVPRQKTYFKLADCVTPEQVEDILERFETLHRKGR